MRGGREGGESVREGAWVYVTQNDVRVKAQAYLNADLADNVVDIQSGTQLAAQLGDAYGVVTVECA